MVIKILLDYLVMLKENINIRLKNLDFFLNEIGEIEIE